MPESGRDLCRPVVAFSKLSNPSFDAAVGSTEVILQTNFRMEEKKCDYQIVPYAKN
jgi:hypothetical protein